MKLLVRVDSVYPDDMERPKLGMELSAPPFGSFVDPPELGFKTEALPLNPKPPE